MEIRGPPRTALGRRAGAVESVRVDFEKLGVFYLGRVLDPASREPTPELLLYDARDLTTHAVIVGMTGSVRRLVPGQGAAARPRGEGGAVRAAAVARWSPRPSGATPPQRAQPHRAATVGGRAPVPGAEEAWRW